MTRTDIIKGWTKGGEDTPAGGVSYIALNELMCAIVYRSKVRLFKDRDPEYMDREIWPCFFRQSGEFIENSDGMKFYEV